MFYCDQCEDELAVYWLIPQHDSPIRLCETCFAAANKARIEKFKEGQFILQVHTPLS